MTAPAPLSMVSGNERSAVPDAGEAITGAVSVKNGFGAVKSILTRMGSPLPEYVISGAPSGMTEILLVLPHISVSISASAQGSASLMTRSL